jgi:hypothetical protein
MFYLCKNSKIKHDDLTLLTAVEISALKVRVFGKK